MSYLRIRVTGQVNKPIPSALSSRWPAIQARVATWKSYARKINEGNPNEEMTVLADIDNQTNYIGVSLELAIPESPTGTLILNTGRSNGIRLPNNVVSELADFRDNIRFLKTYLVSNGFGDVVTKFHLCHHSEDVQTCEAEQEI